MTTLLRPGETLTLGLNVIMRPGDRRGGSLHPMGAYSRSVARAARNEITFVAPQDWVALAGPCPTCEGVGGHLNVVADGPDAGQTTWLDCTCRDGRRVVPLYTECPSPYCDGKGGDKDQPGWRCPNFCNKARVLVGRGSIEVVPVVGPHFQRTEVKVYITVNSAMAVLRKRGSGHWRDAIELTLDPLPQPGKDFGIVIDCVEVAS